MAFRTEYITTCYTYQRDTTSPTPTSLSNNYANLTRSTTFDRLSLPFASDFRRVGKLDAIPVAPWASFKDRSDAMDDSVGSLPPTAERMDASAISSITGRLSASAQADDSRSPSMRRRAETEDSEKAGRVWAREVEEAWWPCILTLDGGGIRGYSSLLILKALMHEIWLWEEKLEAEEAEDQVEDLVDSPLDEEQPSLGAYLREAPLQEPKQSKVEDVRGRSPLKQHMDAADTISIPGDEAEAVEKQHGVSIPSPPPENFAAAAAQHTVHQDNITADISAKKALTEEELLPCHYFDFMYGTSTGGLIGTMLGRLRMTVTECLELYRKVGEDLFGKQKSRIPLRTK